jgi:hypothetical protein
MKKPNYKKANEELMKLLESEPKRISSKNKIIDITKESLEIAYQFTDKDLTIIKSRAPLSIDVEVEE